MEKRSTSDVNAPFIIAQTYALRREEEGITTIWISVKRKSRREQLQRAGDCKEERTHLKLRVLCVPLVEELGSLEAVSALCKGAGKGRLPRQNAQSESMEKNKQL